LITANKQLHSQQEEEQAEPRQRRASVAAAKHYTKLKISFC